MYMNKLNREVLEKLRKNNIEAILEGDERNGLINIPEEEKQKVIGTIHSAYSALISNYKVNSCDSYYLDGLDYSKEANDESEGC